MKAGDEVALTAQVQEVRSDGLVVLTVPGTPNALLPSILVVSASEIINGIYQPAAERVSVTALASKKRHTAESKPAPPKAVNRRGRGFEIGDGVSDLVSGRLGVVVSSESLAISRSVAEREDRLAIQWHGAKAPRWALPEHVRRAEPRK